MGTPGRQFRGWFGFQGDQVTDAYKGVALFQELSRPATLEGSNIADAFGLLPGQRVEVSDAEQAYVQATLGEYATEAWVELPIRVQAQNG